MGSIVVSGLRKLDDAVLTDGGVQRVLLWVGYWFGGVTLTAVTLCSVLAAGAVSVTVGVDDSSWVPVAAGLLPAAAAALVYVVSRRGRTRSVAWVLAMTTALPLSLVPWVFAFTAMAM